jgi:hypothetical protein
LFAMNGAVLAETQPTRASRALRATGVAVVWLLGAAPAILGTARCKVAAVFHRPCPGCGMTRAIHLLGEGDIAASLHMHALGLPVVVSTSFLAAVTVWLTWSQGTPLRLWESRAGRASVWALVAVNVAVVAYWGARMAGALGGPVPVD